LSRKPADWDDFFSALKDAEVHVDFLEVKERNQGLQDRDPGLGLAQPDFSFLLCSQAGSSSSSAMSFVDFMVLAEWLCLYWNRQPLCHFVWY